MQRCNDCESCDSISMFSSAGEIRCITKKNIRKASESYEIGQPNYDFNDSRPSDWYYLVNNRSSLCSK